jgi:N-acetylmuramoyl-L-alanine amidase
MKIVISSGHGKHVRGASGYLDEVDEARRIVNRVGDILGAQATVFHDDVSTTQDANLKRIVDFHNNKQRELDVSVHLNCYDGTASGCECLYVTQAALAQRVADQICAAAGFKNRGPKKRSDLYFLNNTDEPAILIEVCFVDSRTDADLYEAHFEGVCAAIASAITGQDFEEAEPLPPAVPPAEPELPPRSALLTIGHVTIWQMYGGKYVAFVSDLDICNDGSGDSHGDPHASSETAYYNGGEFLNADVDKYIVIPPQVRELLKPSKVMGCQARLTNLPTGAWHAGVCGEIGPDDKTGEAAYCLAKAINPTVGYNSGDLSRVYLFELWPNIPATVDGVTYKLE